MKNYLLIGLKAIGKFLKWIYASELIIGVIGIFQYLVGHKFWAVVLIALAVLLIFNETKNK
jgi:hypothetical protein